MIVDCVRKEFKIYEKIGGYVLPGHFIEFCIQIRCFPVSGAKRKIDFSFQPKKGVLVLKLTGSLERGESYETYQSIPVEGKIDGKTRVEITLTDKPEK